MDNDASGMLPDMRPSEIANPPTGTQESGVAEDPMDIDRRLDKLRELEDGWADGMQAASDWGNGFGKAPSDEGLDWLSAQFAAHYDEELPKPYLYPTPEGGVQAEWSIGPNAPSLEIDLETHVAEWHNLNFDTDRSYEKLLDLNVPDGWMWLANEVRSLVTTAK